MLFLTRWFGVTSSDTERDPIREQSVIEEIVQQSLLLQAKSAAQQHRPIGRGTHVKGVCVRAQFEVLNLSLRNDLRLAKRLGQGIFAKPGIYPATVRFGNSNPKNNSDFKPDVRSMSFSVDLNPQDSPASGTTLRRQDYSLQNTKTLPMNDANAILALANVLTASSPLSGFWALAFEDKLRVLRTVFLAQFQLHQKIKPYQQLRYGSNVPFCHGAFDVVKFSARPSPANQAEPLQRHNSNGLQDELIRHVNEDGVMSSFEFGVQFLDPRKMTYWGKPRDANFWIENASIDWKESEAPFHAVARLTLLPMSHLSADDSNAVYFDVTENSSSDSTPVGSINRARWSSELASRKARLQAANNGPQDSATGEGFGRATNSSAPAEKHAYLSRESTRTIEHNAREAVDPHLRITYARFDFDGKTHL